MYRALVLLFLVLSAPLSAGAAGFVFQSIDGGDIALDEFSGQPVLVVNTASMCAFTPQYDALQDLYDTYRNRGLVVLAVPSDDFNQELADEDQVKEFCAISFDLDLPMTSITHVRGGTAHPFYRWLADEYGFAPSWNFNKVLIGPDGKLAATWGSVVKPTAPSITGAIEPLLAE